MNVTFDAIISQLEEERKRIDSAIQALRGLSSGGATTYQKATGHRRPGKLSPAARARIAAAQRARWARARSAGPKPPATTRAPRTMSAAAKARIAAAQKARWAKFRAAKKK